MHVRNSEKIVDYIMKSKLPQLIKWLKSFWKAFGRKETLPMPTNCCWTLVELSYFWIHVSYFLMVDLTLVMVDIGEHGKAGQVGANFYGPLVVNNLTVAPIWLSTDGCLVTIVCPGNCYNISWGRSGGDSPATKARKAREKAERNAALARAARVRMRQRARDEGN